MRRLSAVQRAVGWQQLTLETRKESVWVWASPGLALHCTVSGHALQEAEAIFEDHIYMIVDILRCSLVKTYTAAHCKFIVVTTVNIIINIPIIIEYKYMSEI